MIKFGKTIKFEVIRNDENQIEGYKLGQYYLMKHYEWGNNYGWIINKTGQSSYFETDFWGDVESGEIVIVSSCKEGKMMLIELNAMA